MTRTEEAIEPGSLEWFRSHAPLPLVLRAFFEVQQSWADFGCEPGDAEPLESMTELRGLIAIAETLAETLEFSYLDDPNAKEIVARFRKLTGSKGSVLPSC
jgi:hypothetical protein